jgi:hypothetical protein
LLNRLLIVSSFTNVLAGAILFVTWASNWATDPERHVPIIVFAIGGAMMIQGLYSAGYTLGWWKAWGDLASGALLAGELISGCVGLGMLIEGIARNASQPDGEMVPVIAGLLIGVNALLGLVVLVQSGKLSPAGVSSNRWGAPL